MFDYTRTTRTCSVSQLHPSLAQAVRDFFQTNQLGDPDTNTVLCCETISTREKPAKLFAWLDGNPDTNIHLATLLTAEWLVWARTGNQTGTLVTGAKFQVIKVKAFVTRRGKNMELEVSGFLNGTKEYVRGSLELGPDIAAQKFCDTLGLAVKEATPPVKRKFPRWMGG